MANRRAKHNRGFTLIEIMVAITLLVVILAMVYGSFSSVVMSIERTRAASERLKTTEFIVHGFTQNLAQAGECWLPGAAFRPYSAPAATGGGAGGGTVQKASSTPADRGDMRGQFTGSIERTPAGAIDAVSFVTTAPVAGVGSLPGQFKMCTYRIEQEKTGDDASAAPAAGEEKKPPKFLLVMTETPWSPAAAEASQTLTGAKPGTHTVNKALSKLSTTVEQKSMTRSVQVYGWDLAYFDGKKWLEEWNSQDIGRLPWSVRVRVKLEPSEDGAFITGTQLDPVKDSSVLELFFEVPAGEGVHDAPPSYVRPTARGAKTTGGTS